MSHYLTPFLPFPAKTASRFSQRLWAIMALAVVLTMLCNTAGLAISYELDVPTGPFVVLLAVGVYGLSLLFRRRRA